MYKVCYRLMTEKSFLDDEFSGNAKMYNYLYGIDEDFDTKKEYIKTAKMYVDGFNEEFETDYTYQDFFGEPIDIGWRRCTKCGETFWGDQSHDCYEV